MNRELKFRVWDKNKRCWLNKIEVAFSLGDWLIWNSEVPATRSIEIMQYTGLKDSQGVEVYEGDIVKYQTHIMAESQIEEVRYKDGCFEPLVSLEPYEPNDFTIIGNIYENVGLPKKENNNE